MEHPAIDKRKEILNLLSEGKLTVDEAAELMATLEAAKTKEIHCTINQARFDLDDDNQPIPAGYSELFDFKIPLSVISIGRKIKGALPYAAHEAIDETLTAFGAPVTLKSLDEKSEEEIADAIGELEIPFSKNQTIKFEYK